ncbi:unnamed protein product, partial [marine sediment metagenome]
VREAVEILWDETNRRVVWAQAATVYRFIHELSGHEGSPESLVTADGPRDPACRVLVQELKKWWEENKESYRSIKSNTPSER